MGDKNKLLLPYNGRLLIEHAVEQLLAGKWGEVIVVTGNEKEEIGRLIEKNNYPVKPVINNDYNKGMTTSIQAGVQAMSEKASGFMVCQADMPLLKGLHYQLLIDAFENLKTKQGIVVPQYQGKRGNPVVFSVSYKPEVLAEDYPEGCRNIVRKYTENITFVEMPDNAILVDVDTADDYKELSD